MDTRTQILQKNFQSIRLNGFQGARADKAVSEMGVTKGALYHYFPNKKSLGYAIVDEIIAPAYTSVWKSIETADNPIDALVESLQKIVQMQTEKDIKLGCPLNNLMQEMSPLDAGFRTRFQKIIQSMENSLAAGLKQAQKKGLVRKQIDVKRSAVFIVASFEGAFSIAKTMQSKAVFESAIQTLIDYIESLQT
jgi:AcrR family transcriptional regulator